MGTEIKIASAAFNSLNRAVTRGNHTAVSTALQENPDLVNQYQSITYESAIANTLKQHPIDYKMLEILVRNKVAFDYPINHHNELPLEWACKIQDDTLVKFLLKHGAIASEQTSHFLLAQGTNIKFLNIENLLRVCKIIDALGGLDAVAANKNLIGDCFNTKAAQSQLFNAYGGVLKYNYMDLLKAAYPIRNELPESGTAAQEQYKIVNDIITKIHTDYAAKQEKDRVNLKSTISLYFLTGREYPPLREVEDAPAIHNIL